MQKRILYEEGLGDRRFFDQNLVQVCRTAWERPLPSERKKTLFHHLVMFFNIMKYNRCYCITEDDFACLGTLFCPKIVPKRDLCLPGSRLRGRLPEPFRITRPIAGAACSS